MLKLTFNNLDPCELQDYLINKGIKPLFTTSDIKSDVNGIELSPIAENIAMDFDDNQSEEIINILVADFKNVSTQ